MLFRLAGRLTYANVVATLALFVALGGSSYAALKVTGKNVKNDSLTGKDVRNNSLSSGDIRNRSLLGRDFKAGQLPSGARGADGPAGPRGPSDAYRAFSGQIDAVGTTPTEVVSVDVPAGSYAVSARVELVGSNQPGGALASCRLSVGSASDNASGSIRPLGGPDSFATLPLTTAGTLSTAGSIDISCNAPNGGHTFGVNSASITATRVESIRE